MVTYMPVPSATITFASKWVDEALGFAMGWNYFLNMFVLRYWSDNYTDKDLGPCLSLSKSWP
jgi:L-asparagine transporter-like permease